MSRVIDVPLSVAGINGAIRAVKEYKKMLKKLPKFLDALAEEGMEVANINFSQIQYDGDTKVECEVKNTGRLSRVVVAKGKSVIFIEFGSGVNFPDDHPEAAKNGFVHGEYGHHLGRRTQGWRYKGDPGTNGILITEGKHKGEVKTRGNPANMCMYNARKHLEEHFEEIARRVFLND